MRSASVFQLLGLVLVLLAVAGSSQAIVPRLVSFQGRLTDNTGTPLNGTYSLTFSLYPADSGGLPYWSETQSSVNVTNGLFTVILGSVNALSDGLFNNAPFYLGVRVGADPELVPRTCLTTSPYAMRVASVHGASGGTISSSIYVFGDVGSTGSLTANKATISGPVTATLSSSGDAFHGESLTSNTSSNTGIYAVGEHGSANFGIYAQASDAISSPYASAAVYAYAVSFYGGTIWAGDFDGWTNVNGNFYATAKFFKIDDPKQPADRTLTHSCVESDEYKNIYDGVITTDDSGNATVTLPDWFDGLNREFRYQLTCIGQFAQAIVSSEISGNRFSIKTDRPMVKVSWQVTGVRKDAYATAHPFSVIEEKPAALRGKYLNPTELGMDETQGVSYATRKFVEEQRQAAQEAARPRTSTEPASH